MKKSIIISRSKTFIKAVLLPLLFAFLFIQCKEDVVEPDAQDMLLESLAANNWIVDNEASSFEGEDTLDESTWAVAFSVLDNDVSFTFGGDLAYYLTDGSFTVAKDASIEGEVIGSGGEWLSVTTSTVCCNSPYDCIAMEVKTTLSETHSEGGVGTYTIVFTK